MLRCRALSETLPSPSNSDSPSVLGAFETRFAVRVAYAVVPVDVIDWLRDLYDTDRVLLALAVAALVVPFIVERLKRPRLQFNSSHGFPVTLFLGTLQPYGCVMHRSAVASARCWFAPLPHHVARPLSSGRTVALMGPDGGPLEFSGSAPTTGDGGEADPHWRQPACSMPSRCRSGGSTQGLQRRIRPDRICRRVGGRRCPSRSFTKAVTLLRSTTRRTSMTFAIRSRSSIAASIRSPSVSSPRDSRSPTVPAELPVH